MAGSQEGKTDFKRKAERYRKEGGNRVERNTS